MSIDARATCTACIKDLESLEKTKKNIHTHKTLIIKYACDYIYTRNLFDAQGNYVQQNI